MNLPLTEEERQMASLRDNYVDDLKKPLMWEEDFYPQFIVTFKKNSSHLDEKFHRKEQQIMLTDTDADTICFVNDTFSPTNKVELQKIEGSLTVSALEFNSKTKSVSKPEITFASYRPLTVTDHIRPEVTDHEQLRITNDLHEVINDDRPEETNYDLHEITNHNLHGVTDHDSPGVNLISNKGLHHHLINCSSNIDNNIANEKQLLPVYNSVGNTVDVILTKSAENVEVIQHNEILNIKDDVDNTSANKPNINSAKSDNDLIRIPNNEYANSKYIGNTFVDNDNLTKSTDNDVKLNEQKYQKQNSDVDPDSKLQNKMDYCYGKPDTHTLTSNSVHLTTCNGVLNDILSKNDSNKDKPKFSVIEQQRNSDNFNNNITDNNTATKQIDILDIRSIDGSSIRKVDSNTIHLPQRASRKEKHSSSLQSNEQKKVKNKDDDACSEVNIKTEVHKLHNKETVYVNENTIKDNRKIDIAAKFSTVAKKTDCGFEASPSLNNCDGYMNEISPEDDSIQKINTLNLVDCISLDANKVNINNFSFADGNYYGAKDIDKDNACICSDNMSTRPNAEIKDPKLENDMKINKIEQPDNKITTQNILPANEKCVNHRNPDVYDEEQNAIKDNNRSSEQSVGQPAEQTQTNRQLKLENREFNAFQTERKNEKHVPFFDPSSEVGMNKNTDHTKVSGNNPSATCVQPLNLNSNNLLLADAGKMLQSAKVLQPIKQMFEAKEVFNSDNNISEQTSKILPMIKGIAQSSNVCADTEFSVVRKTPLTLANSSTLLLQAQTELAQTKERKMTETEQFVAVEFEEQRTFVILSILNPITNEAISFSEAILREILKPADGLYCNPVNGEMMSIQEAMCRGLIAVEHASTKRGRERTSTCGIITVKTVREAQRPFYVLWAVNTATSTKLSSVEAITAGIINEKQQIYVDTKSTKVMFIEDAAEKGLVGIEYLSSESVETEVIKKVYVVRAVVNTRLQKTITFQHALQMKIIDKENGTFRDTATDQLLDISEALMHGFIKARVMDNPEQLDIDPENILFIDKTDLI